MQAFHETAIFQAGKGAEDFRTGFFDQGRVHLPMLGLREHEIETVRAWKGIVDDDDLPQAIVTDAQKIETCTVDLLG